MGVKRRLAASARVKKSRKGGETRSCIVCGGGGVFEYRPDLRFAPSELPPELLSTLATPTQYYCPLCQPDAHGIKREHGGGPNALPAGAMKSKSACLFATLVNSGIDPYVALDVQDSATGTLDSISAAEAIMTERANTALLVPEFGQPEKPEREPTAMLETITSLNTLPIVREACKDVRTAAWLKLAFQATQWYPDGSKVYESMVRDELGKLSSVAEVVEYLEDEGRLLEQGLLLDTYHSSLACPPVLLRGGTAQGETAEDEEVTEFIITTSEPNGVITLDDSTL
ncbi:hypothetical protein GNI_089470 [Gregarina niphandrodes]|uniref:Uncharacterized protein n=1 Tax=Gregarina niphandrodes TaxID=110365 RepID=A0A023B5K5_GRENI|nr:hypothetical protein GNI_089470 [Gregarina niphandrodes]EZG61144.1 hypothetical protein GNI_089470 [Gregarina niphandrodes]|eukprot:XP_011130797.1 hypothetical protein GNI_089470 [Gregarina niphandrodes]